MNEPIAAGLVIVLAIGGGSFVAGWQQGRAGPAKRLAALEAVQQAETGRLRRERDEAQATVDRLTIDALQAVKAPEIETRFREVTRYVPAKPLPPGACADAGFVRRLLDAQSADGDRGAEGRDPARAAGPDASATADSAGFVSARGFREWAVAVVQQHRGEMIAANALKAIVPTLPCVKVVD